MVFAWAGSAKCQTLLQFAFVWFEREVAVGLRYWLWVAGCLPCQAACLPSSSMLWLMFEEKWKGIVFHGWIQLLYLLLLSGICYLLASPLWKEDGFLPVLSILCLHILCPCSGSGHNSGPIWLSSEAEMTALLRLQNTKNNCGLKCKRVLAFQQAFADAQSCVSLVQLWLDSGVIYCCLLWEPGQVHHGEACMGTHRRVCTGCSLDVGLLPEWDWENASERMGPISKVMKEKNGCFKGCLSADR